MSEAATLDSLPLLASGKVREMYELGDRILMVASDRISTYDVVHPTPIPGKGQVLTGISVFWFDRTGHICRNHVVSYTDVPDEARGRALLVERLEMFPVECVARGYLTGSGWKDYQESGAVCGIELPPGLQESQQLPEPIFTPATKAEVGDHDENVDVDRAAEILGDRPLLEELRRLTLALYTFAAEHARADPRVRRPGERMLPLVDHPVAREFVRGVRQDLGGLVERLVRAGRPELTIEYAMTDPYWRPLFGPQHREAAQWRLDRANVVRQ